MIVTYIDFVYYWISWRMFLYNRPFSIRNQLQATILNSWFNLLLLFAPVGLALNYVNVNLVTIFVNFLAILLMGGIIGAAMGDL